MTDASDALDRAVLAYLDQHRDHPPTVGEIYDALGIPTSSIRASLRRLTAARKVARAGQGRNGGYTWTIRGRR